MKQGAIETGMIKLDGVREQHVKQQLHQRAITCMQREEGQWLEG